MEKQVKRLFTYTSLMCSLFPLMAVARTEKPNIVVIFGDDIG
jgi:hypothetical protein